MLVSSYSFAYIKGDKVGLGTTPNCSGCVEAKQILRSKGIPFKLVKPSRKYSNYVPQLFVNGKYKGYGVGVVISYANR